MIETIIIGGGITGAFSAYLAALRGIAVTVITGNEEAVASHINPGGINPLHGPGIPGAMEDFSMQAYRLHLSHWQNIQQLSGIGFNGRIIERLLLAFDEEEKLQLLNNRNLYQNQCGFSAQWLTPEEICGKDSRITDKALGGLYTRGNATVDAERYTTAVLLAAQKLGAAIVCDTALSIIQKTGSYEIACVSGEKLVAQQIVVANGARSRELLKTVAMDIPLTPVKGELLLVKVSDRPFDFDITCKNDGLYHFRDDLYWLGGTREDVGYDFSLSDGSAQGIEANAAILIPGIRKYAITKHLVAMRPTTPDGLPVVGRLKSGPNLYIATGAGSKGMLWSARMADSIVNMLGNQTAERDSACLSPDRFLQ